MKNQRLRFKLIALLLIAMMVLCAVFGGYSVLKYGNRWFSSRWNNRLSEKKATVTPGDIRDRNGVTLATTQDGYRVYQNDSASRRAGVHILGDREGQVANGVETFEARYLYGFETTAAQLFHALLAGGKTRGDDVTLTIDSALCTRICRSFAANAPGKNGAAVVMNYLTGEVLALISLPDFDPDNMAEVAMIPGQPYWNRATQGLYTPGSTFKVVTAAAALTQLPGIENETLTCTGALPVDGHAITDWAGESHGSLSLRSAFMLSCNNVFASLAQQLGNEKLRKTAESFGFNDNFLFRDLVVENSRFPSEEQTAWSLAWSGAGQSTITATPLHMCMIASAIANEGVMMEPRLVRSVTGSGGEVILKPSASVYRRSVSPETAATLKDYMRSVVNMGTGYRAAVNGMTICGKTGTAETALDGRAVTNGWFIGFNADSTLPIALCVLVEDIQDGEGGGAAAGPIAADIFRYAKEHPGLVTADPLPIADPTLEGLVNSAKELLFNFSGLLEQVPGLLTLLPDPAATATPITTATPTAAATASPTPGPAGLLDNLREQAGEAAGAFVQEAVQNAINGFLGK